MTRVFEQSELTEANELFDRWSKLDDRKLTKNPISIRLPIQLMARLTALNEVHSTRNRSELIIDLLNAGLAQFETKTPTYDPELTILPTKENPQPGLLSALGASYRQSANAHYKRLAKEIGANNVSDLFNMNEGKHD